MENCPNNYVIARLLDRRQCLDIGKPYVYLWFRASQCLYIGVTENFFERLTGHNVLGQVEPYQDIDSIDFIECSNVNEARHLERELIASLQPKYNINSRGPSA